MAGREPSVRVKGVDSYIRARATAASLINMVVNPLISWFGNREMEPTSLASVAIDTAATSVIMSIAVGFFVASEARRALEGGKIRADDRLSGGRLSHLPAAGWAFGLIAGSGFATILAPLAFGLLAVIGLAEIPFWGLVLFKIIYTAGISFLVATWVIRRQLRRTGLFEQRSPVR